jgi:hypothetical protein
MDPDGKSHLAKSPNGPGSSARHLLIEATLATTRRREPGPSRGPMGLVAHSPRKMGLVAHMPHGPPAAARGRLGLVAHRPR